MKRDVKRRNERLTGVWDHRPKRVYQLSPHLPLPLLLDPFEQIVGQRDPRALPIDLKCGEAVVLDIVDDLLPIEAN